MAGKAKTAQSAGRGGHKQHYCSEHDALCQGMLHMPGRKMQWHCPKGCVLPKNQTVLK